MFRWFENRLDPFPIEELSEPPRKLLPFCLHFTRGAWPYIILASILMAGIAITEVWLFGFLGNIVDWLSAQTRETFLQNEGWKLAGMAFIVLVALPTLIFVNSLTTHQTLMGNYPMRIRWLVHRYLLKQSMAFYQDEFAGRIATKLMQTALAVRECVIKLVDVLNYIAVYFIGTLVLVGMADWRLTLPMLAWLVGYVLLMRHYIPVLGQVANVQADARSVMTGRIVDSYTNIQTVKLFSHAKRESDYAREGMNEFMVTVYQQMRLVTTLYTLLYILNALLLLGVAGTALWLWVQGSISVGAVAVAVGLVLRLWGMSQWIMWELSALFENIGTVQDGINSISRPQVVNDLPEAKPLQVPHGDIRFEAVEFHYGKGGGVMDHLNLHIRPGEKIGLVGRSGAGKSTLVNLLLRFYDVESGRILIDGQNIAEVQQDSLRAQIGMVTQDTSLLHRSVRDNILYGRPDADEQMMRKAARNAEADQFIASLEDAKGRFGYDAHVGERGVKLSGGQRQRIAIARALIMKPDLLILDEPTSALDRSVQAQVLDLLRDLQRRHGLSYLFISHDLKVVRALSHRLLVMRQGQVVEHGDTETVFQRPAHDYTRTLIDAAFSTEKKHAVAH